MTARSKLPHPPRPSAPFTTPPNAGIAHARRDDAIQICVNNTVNQIRGRDNGANHISLSVSSGTVNLTGNVLTPASNDTITNAAKSCGAKVVNSNNLRIGW